MRRLAAASISALILALAACGDDDEGRVDVSGGTDTAGTTTTGTSTEKAAPAGAPVATVRVAETEFRLSPANPSVAKTGVVEFRIRNVGKIAHALEVEGPEGEVETEEIAPGSSETLKADAGKYTWYCPIGDHEARGMKGQITVAGGEGGARGPGSDAHGGY